MIYNGDKNLMHPIEHSVSRQSGCYIDIHEEYEKGVKKHDSKATYENLSNPPFFIERYSPVSTEVNGENILGTNFTRMMLKAHSKFMELMNEASLQNKILIKKMGENAFVPYLGIAYDPATLHKALDIEFETGTKIYRNYMHLLESGILNPTITFPFHSILPLLESEYDLKFMIRTGIEFYMPLIKRSHKYAFEKLGEKRFVVGVWFPECAYTNRIGELTAEIFYELAKENGLDRCQLFFMFDAGQSTEQNKDELIKRLNYVKLGKYRIWAYFRENYFSNWLCFQNPSIKKVLDKTLAKLNTDPQKNIAEYIWCHFFEYDALIHSKKSAINFKNIIVKFFETQYLPLSPDEYLRRKLLKIYLSFNYEPAQTEIVDNTSWVSSATWGDNDYQLTRWSGLRVNEDEKTVCDHPKEITRIELDADNNPIMDGKEIKIDSRLVSQCWKIAINSAKQEIIDFIRGDVETGKGGIFDIFAKFVAPENLQEEVLNLLVAYQKLYFKEHFIYLLNSTFDLKKLITENLTLKKKRLAQKDLNAIGFALRSYYMAMEATRSSAVHWENFDNQYVYQASVFMTLSLINLSYSYNLQGMTKEKDAAIKMIEDVLVHFENSYDRYQLKGYKVLKKEFNETLKPTVEGTKYNVVTRAARRVAAIHLLREGKCDFLTEKDKELNAYTDHVWNGELHRANIEWEEPNFCSHLEF